LRKLLGELHNLPPSPNIKLAKTWNVEWVEQVSQTEMKNLRKPWRKKILKAAKL
jgi:hypothetical protein